MEIVRVDEWGRWPWLKHGFSVRAGGVSEVYGAGALNLGLTKDDDAGAVAENRRRLVEAVAGSGEAGLVAVRQVHGTVVKVVRGSEDGVGVEADGLVTDVPGLMVGVLAADCVPVLVADTRRRVVGAFHAGWRGTVAGMVGRGIARMVEEFGADVKDMVGAVGPSIGGCCYVVGEELRREFRGRFGDSDELLEEREDGLHLDLAEANRRQLVGAGIAADRVTVVGECTACARVDGRRKYFSHRAEGGFTGRGMGVIGIGGRV